MKPYYADDLVTVHHGDCLDILAKLPDASVDAVVTDPPYGLEFMGREWDGADGFRRSLSEADAGRGNVFGRTSRTSPEYRAGSLFQRWCQQWAAECLRVLKPGGHLLTFGGTRTWHRLTAGIEDAGFEVRDTITWLYGSGFPKSLDVSKAIDKAAGADREVVGPRVRVDGKAPGKLSGGKHGTFGDFGLLPDAATAPATDDARQWSGWDTALKPASEPIVVARKPLAGTVAANVLAHGTGALNIDACRVSAAESTVRNNRAPRFNGDSYANGQTYAPAPWASGSDAGRWPTNVVLSHGAVWDDDADDLVDACGDGCVEGCPVAELDAQSGVLTSGANPTRRRSPKFGDAYGEFTGAAETLARGADSGGASRFFPVFRYEAKASARERPRVDGVEHPTVKPLDLMRWLTRLVCPPGGTVLDPFAGSGTTAEACALEGFRCVAVEREAEYLPLIIDRLSKPMQPSLDLFGGAA